MRHSDYQSNKVYFRYKDVETINIFYLIVVPHYSFFSWHIRALSMFVSLRNNTSKMAPVSSASSPIIMF